MTTNDSRWPAIAEAYRADRDAICGAEPPFARDRLASAAVSVALIVGAVVAICAGVLG